MLSVPDEESLAHYAVLLRLCGTDTEWFYEPDLDDELTAIAAAGPVAAKRLSRLPLLLREEVIGDGREHVVAAG
jgi:hypothetical protein